MGKFCEYLKEHEKNIIDFKKKKKLPLKNEVKTHQDVKVCYICRKIILKKLSKSTNYLKVRDHCHYTWKYRDAAHNNLKLNASNEIPGVFQKSSSYNYHFIIKLIAKEFQE